MISYYQQHPLRVIVFLALVIRLVAAVFSIGYGFHDDHFLVIEVAHQWTQNLNIRGWMPWDGNTTPSGHSLFYPGLHYLYFKGIEAIGIHNPEIKMLILRIIHALYSTLTVYYSYLIVRKLSGIKSANTVGLVLALLWCLPMLSVRNLVEMVCIPPLVIATWIAINADEKQQKSMLITAGLIAGLAFSVRFQTATFVAGFVAAFWLQKKWMQGLLFGIGAFVSIVLIQGGIDYYIWGRPFAEFIEYSSYNLDNASNYINGPWYNYLLLIAGLFIPPLSFMIFRGMYQVKKEYLFIILPALLFFIFHSSYPNKQERFILPVIPFFIMAGIAGWHKFAMLSTYWNNHPKREQNLWKAFWILNTLLLIILTPSSTKTSRVKAMSYLYDIGSKGTFLIENSNTGKSITMPQFYLNNYSQPHEINKNNEAEKVIKEMLDAKAPMPEYIIFAEGKNLKEREEKMHKYIQDFQFEAEIPSSYLDNVMSWLNPVNVSQTYYIYKVKSTSFKALNDSASVASAAP